MIIKSKKGDLVGNILVVIISLIIFFALFPAMSALIDVATSSYTGGDATVTFLISSTTFFILLGLIKWIYNSVAGE